MVSEVLVLLYFVLVQSSFIISHACVSCFLSVPLGYTRCDGQPAVHPGGNSLENLLEVQPESGRRCHVGCVSAQDLQET